MTSDNDKSKQTSVLTIASGSTRGSAVSRVAALHGRHTRAAVVTRRVHLLRVAIACGGTGGATAVAVVAIARSRRAAVTRRCEASATVVATSV